MNHPSSVVWQATSPIQLITQCSHFSLFLSLPSPAELVWKIYTGSKRTTKEVASIFVFDKKQLELFTKDEREEICENIRRGVVQLTKIRHPQVLTVQHAMEESRDTIAFATEPVVASLANLLGNTTNVSNTGLLAEYKLSEFDTKFGIFELIKGIRFLHDEVQLVHRHLCTENIIVNKQGVWKLFGFGFCWSKRAPGTPVGNHPFKSRLLGNPGSKWTAPELILENTCNDSTDIYSLGSVTKGDSCSFEVLVLMFVIPFKVF